jgi:hypothetical protein
MVERTALKAMEAIDKDRMVVGMSVRQIIHLLHDYIPRSCMREAEDKLFDAFFINGTELTSNMMRKEYEAWKELELNTLALHPTFKVQS